MGQKINPFSFRLSVNKRWTAKWFASGAQYKKQLIEDVLVRKYLLAKLAKAAVSNVVIERSSNQLKIMIHTARPGVIIGRGGTGTEDLKKAVEKITKKKVAIDIIEVQNPEIVAALIAQNIAEQIEKRIPFKRAIKQAMEAAKKAKVLGIKVVAKGRLGGAEIAREEKYATGSVPLQTLRADLDYAEVTAHTTYGTIGVKVWVNAQGLHTEKNEEIVA